MPSCKKKVLYLYWYSPRVARSIDSSLLEVVDTHTALTPVEHITTIGRPVKTVRFVMGDHRTTRSTTNMITRLFGKNLYTREELTPDSRMCRINHGLIGIPGEIYLHPVTLSTQSRTTCICYLLQFCRMDTFYMYMYVYRYWTVE